MVLPLFLVYVYLFETRMVKTDPDYPTCSHDYVDICKSHGYWTFEFYTIIFCKFYILDQFWLQIPVNSNMDGFEPRLDFRAIIAATAQSQHSHQ